MIPALLTVWRIAALEKKKDRNKEIIADKKYLLVHYAEQAIAFNPP